MTVVDRRDERETAEAVEDPVTLLEEELGAHVVGDVILDPEQRIDPGYWLPPGPRWRRPSPTPAPDQAVQFGAEGRKYGRKEIDKNGDEKIRTTTLRHVWALCTECNEGVMRRQGSGPKRCVMTPKCEGFHRP